MQIDLCCQQQAEASCVRGRDERGSVLAAAPCHVCASLACAVSAAAAAAVVPTFQRVACMPMMQPGSVMGAAALSLRTDASKTAEKKVVGA